MPALLLTNIGQLLTMQGPPEIFSRPLQGRSLIAAPWGVLSQVSPTDEQRKRMLVQTLDIDELREFRRKLPSRTHSTVIDAQLRELEIPLMGIDPERLN